MFAFREVGNKGAIACCAEMLPPAFCSLYQGFPDAGCGFRLREDSVAVPILPRREKM
jgi:hypothetical protein